MWRKKAVWIACLAALLVAGSVAVVMATGGDDSTDGQAVAAAQSEVSALVDEMVSAGLNVTDSGYVPETGQDPAYYRIQIQTGEWDKYLWDYDLATRILAKAKAGGYIAVDYADVILVDVSGDAIPHLAEIQHLDTELWADRSESGCAAIEERLVAQVKKTAEAHGFGVLHFSVTLTNGTPAAVIDLAMPEAIASGDLNTGTSCSVQAV